MLLTHSRYVSETGYLTTDFLLIFGLNNIFYCYITLTL